MTRLPTLNLYTSLRFARIAEERPSVDARSGALSGRQQDAAPLLKSAISRRFACFRRRIFRGTCYRDGNRRECVLHLWWKSDAASALAVLKFSDTAEPLSGRPGEVIRIAQQLAATVSRSLRQSRLANSIGELLEVLGALEREPFTKVG